MNTTKYQVNELPGFVIGLVIFFVISGIAVYTFGSTATLIQKNVTVFTPTDPLLVANMSETVLSNNATDIFGKGTDSFKTLTAFMPVYAIGIVAIGLIGLFLKNKGYV